jgi:hypothetical protein
LGDYLQAQNYLGLSFLTSREFEIRFLFQQAVVAMFLAIHPHMRAKRREAGLSDPDDLCTAYEYSFSYSRCCYRAIADVFA